jgi:hypothetical protein
MGSGFRPLGMPVNSQFEKSSAAAAPDAVAVRKQLEILLAHPLFAHSKRYPVLLEYTVEQTLRGNAESLKERTIGVEAFGRDPSYDVNLDPIVRTTAAEVRKKLVQYYYNPEHADKLIIEFPVGCYVPSFREPELRQVTVPPNPGTTPTPSSRNTAAAPPLRPVVHPALWFTRLSSRWSIGLAASLLVLVMGSLNIFHMRLQKRPSEIERFWQPTAETPGNITYCLGQTGSLTNSTGGKQPTSSLKNSLNISDVTTLARSVGMFARKKGAFRVVLASEVGLAQLREGPFVLIGAFDNDWTLRITKNLPFGFVAVSGVGNIVDRRSGQVQTWTSIASAPGAGVAKDYAIVARIHDKVTGQPVIVLAGISAEGTAAAGEVVSNPEFIEAVLQKAPPNWDQRNLEAVIETNVVDGQPGPPSAVAVVTW